MNAGSEMWRELVIEEELQAAKRFSKSAAARTAGRETLYQRATASIESHRLK
jgi:hypothetical protein